MKILHVEYGLFVYILSQVRASDAAGKHWR